MSDTTPQTLLVDLGELHTRTHVSPLPTHPGAFGWQMTAGAMAALAARLLHNLHQVAPEQAQQIAYWFDGPFGEGPDAEEHTDWLERTVAGSSEVMAQWVEEGRESAVGAQQATIDWEKEQKASNASRDIHTHFGLSYANYLVLPRTLLQSMPAEWQHQMVVLLEQMDSAFEHVPQAEVYEVTAGEWMPVGDMTDAQLKAAGITQTRGNFATDDPADGDLYHRASDGAELSGTDEGFVPGVDPVPHYNRGRTRVEPRLDGAA
jgi:hypothetical protein